ncbi:hypothetical protein U1Q18_048674 [Sarracenia purpurea var. burkii]
MNRGINDGGDLPRELLVELARRGRGRVKMFRVRWSWRMGKSLLLREIIRRWFKKPASSLSVCISEDLGRRLEVRASRSRLRWPRPKWSNIVRRIARSRLRWPRPKWSNIVRRRSAPAALYFSPINLGKPLFKMCYVQPPHCGDLVYARHRKRAKNHAASNGYGEYAVHSGVPARPPDRQAGRQEDPSVTSPMKHDTTHRTTVASYRTHMYSSRGS